MREFTVMMPECDDDPPRKDDLEAAIGDALKNEDDFARVFLLTQAKLGYTFAD